MPYERITDPGSVKQCYDALQEAVGGDLWDPDRELAVAFWTVNNYRVGLNETPSGSRFQVNVGEDEADGEGMFATDGDGKRWLTHSGSIYEANLPQKNPYKQSTRDEIRNAFRDFSAASRRWVSVDGDERYLVCPIDMDREVILDNMKAAVSVVLAFKDLDAAIEYPSDESNRNATEFSGLAEKLLLSKAFLRRVEYLLDDKRQIIFQGPPGTGKTHAALAISRHLAGTDGDVSLVQFHPSFAYEDFVQGFRPRLIRKRPGFELKHGPLLKAAERARKVVDGKHFLVIDEINRGNLSKVFGELYFLLEYRNEQIHLQYGDEPFSLPENLYIITSVPLNCRTNSIGCPSVQAWVNRRRSKARTKAGFSRTG